MPSERRRFRFSLRTLVLLVLLCGSGYALWMHWGPWQEISVFPGHGAFAESERAGFSADGRTITFLFAWENSVKVSTIDVASGERIKLEVLPHRDVPNSLGSVWRDWYHPETDIELTATAIRPADLPPMDQDEWEGFAMHLNAADRLQLTRSDDGPQYLIREFPVRVGDVTFSKHGDMFAVVDWSSMCHVFRYRRPEAWTGITARPELWFTAVFFLALMGSIWKDRRSSAGPEQAKPDER
jgi:hypothetical protein